MPVTEWTTVARITTTYMPRTGILVMGDLNQRASEGIFTRQDAVAELDRLGYLVTSDWMAGQYGAESAYCARKWC